MAVKKVQNKLLIQYLIYGYSVQISILSFQHENCKRMPPLAFKSDDCDLPMPVGC